MADFSLNDNGYFSKNSKTIIPNFSFLGEFNSPKKDVSNLIIKPWHIRSVSYEQYTFKQEGQYHGPGILKTFPVLDRGEAGAYVLRVTLEEDNEGTIAMFIEWLKSLIINANGVYNTIADIKSSLTFKLTILTEPQQIIRFLELYFLTAEQAEYSYADGDLKTYTISFAYDNYEYVKPLPKP